MNTTKKSSWIIIFLLFSSQAFCQKEPCKIKDTLKEIVWDFNTGELTEPCCIVKGKNLPITIKNINTTLFEATIESDFIDYHRTSYEIIDFNKKLAVVQEELAKKATDSQEEPAIADNPIEPSASETLGILLKSSRILLSYGTCLSAVLQQDIGEKAAEEKSSACTNGKSREDFKADLDYLQQAILSANSFIKNQQDGDPALQKINEQREEVMKELDLQETITNIMMLYDKINNPKTFKISTIIPIKDAYELALKLQVIPKADVPFSGSKINLNYAIKGIKVSFSPGLFVNHFPGAQTYYLEDYKEQDIPTDSVVIRSTFNDQSLVPSIGALIHVSFGGCKDYDFAISAGASTRLESGDMRWHLGTSILLGKQRRFVLSAGLTLGQGIQEIDQNYQLDQPYPTADLEGKTLTTKVPHLGWFIGFSYNLPIQPQS